MWTVWTEVSTCCEYFHYRTSLTQTRHWFNGHFPVWVSLFAVCLISLFIHFSLKVCILSGKIKICPVWDHPILSFVNVPLQVIDVCKWCEWWQPMGSLATKVIWLGLRVISCVMWVNSHNGYAMILAQETFKYWFSYCCCWYCYILREVQLRQNFYWSCTSVCVSVLCVCLPLPHAHTTPWTGM